MIEKNLEGMIEIDEDYFTTKTSEYEHKAHKSDSGNKTKSNVMNGHG